MRLTEPRKKNAFKKEMVGARRAQDAEADRRNEVHDNRSPQQAMKATKHDGANLVFYAPAEMHTEIREQAARLERSISYTMQLAWRIARKRVWELPEPRE